MTLSRVTERAKEAAKEPSRAWRNKWLVIKATEYDDGETLAPGDEYTEGYYPTKEDAERFAREYLEDDLTVWGSHVERYLGAFPIGPA